MALMTQDERAAKAKADKAALDMKRLERARQRAAVKKAEDAGKRHHERELRKKKARQKTQQRVGQSFSAWLFGTSKPRTRQPGLSEWLFGAKAKKKKKWYDPF